MKRINNNNKLFTKSGCLTRFALFGYVKQTLTNKQAEKVREHLQGCDLCRDSTEGMSAFRRHDHEAELNKIDYGIKKHVRNRKERKNLRIQYIAAAASVIIISGLLWALNRQFPDSENQVLAEHAPVLLLKDESVRAPALPDHVITHIDDHAMPVQRVKEDRIHHQEIKKDKQLKPADRKDSSQQLTIHTPLKKAPVKKRIMQKKVEEDYFIIPSQRIHHGYSFDEGSRAAAITMNYHFDESLSRIESAQFPSFHGQHPRKFLDYIADHLKYPEEALKTRKEGKVYIEFIVNKYGEIHDATVKSSTAKVFEEAALQVVQEAPKWEPAMINGENASVRFVFPICFSIK